MEPQNAPLNLTRLLQDRRLVVVGGTGFLGKVWWAHLLHHFPGVGHLYLVVRARQGMTAEQRFAKEIAVSEVLEPLRKHHGQAFEAFLRSKVTPLFGDVSHPLCGIPEDVRRELRGRVDAVVNSAGVVDFDPPLDEALEVNAFGVQNLVNLARELGDLPLLHTSTCFVAGNRTGNIDEVDPREFPFPRAGELDRSHWDPDREIAESMDVVKQARQRADDAFRQSHFLDQAKKNLKDRREPTRGGVLDAELQKVKRKFVEDQLSDMGMERAHFWGFPNTYTYTKAIGEQIVASSGLPFAIVRPAIVESTVSFPFPSWNEGINTSAPLIYSMREGQFQIPGSDNNLDLIPCDMVASGLTLALGELLEGTAKPVYQLGSSDVNPCSMKRFFELSGLYKRKYYQRTNRGGPVLSFLQSHFEGSLLTQEQFHTFGPSVISKGARSLSGLLKKAAVGPAAAVLAPSSKALHDFSEQQRKVGRVLNIFLPFICEYQYSFRCDNTRAALARVTSSDRALLNWDPEGLDWRQYFLEIHIPALERWVFPKIDEKLKKKAKPPRPHETLTALLEEMAERYDLSVALQRTELEGLSRISFREWRARATACAARLQAAGVGPKDRVLLAGHNHPAWAISFFGILLAGATVVPLDSAVEATVADNLLRASDARAFVGDGEVAARVLPGLQNRIPWFDMEAVAESGEAGQPVEVAAEDVAALIYTSGTTGKPKGVMLTHGNLTALIASLAPLFPLGRGDRVLSVLPLHHTFELTCGLLLPLSRGSRVIYLDELNAERLEVGLKQGRATALIGVPAVWEMLERRILAKVAERGKLTSTVFEMAVELNRTLGKSFGLDLGRSLFGSVHDGLGGHLRFLVSGGAALPERTHQLFSGLGLHLAEGYGLTEAAPVLTVAKGGPRTRPGHVGKPVPGVELKISEPGKDGVGEVLARGPSVMLGYADDPEATAQVLDAEGWLHTGDLGKLDRRGNLVISGRAKDTIVTSTGENVYPDDVEARLGAINHIKELTILAVTDPRGGERIGCLAVAAPDTKTGDDERLLRARASLDRALVALPVHLRPTLVRVTSVSLPRTATRKVRRNEVRRLMEYRESCGAHVPAFPGSESLDGVAQRVRRAVASIARRAPGELRAEMSLRGDLAFDSLMLLELLVALEQEGGGSVDAEKMNQALTVGDVEVLVRENAHGRRAARTQARIEKEDVAPVEIPEPVRAAAMHWLGRAQMGFYEQVLKVDLAGQAYIPHNRNTLVVANHASHLDMGLVKYALGKYGEGIVSLAAQDYFFDRSTLHKTYFENFTNLLPMSRTGSLRESLTAAGNKLDEGHTVLVFPEGTRFTDGQIHEFKAAVGYLALEHEVDILPIWLGNTHLALPKHARIPRSRELIARIGAPLRVEDLRRLTTGLRRADAARAVAKLAERAVRELSQSRVLDLSTLTELRPSERVPPASVPPSASIEAHAEGPVLLGASESAQNTALSEPPAVDSLARVFEELQGRFLPGATDRPVSYYFSLGEDRWTVKVSRDTCEVIPGKAASSADCVLKTSPDIFTRIVREAYTPSPAEFLAGLVKSNNVALLFTFQKVFQLTATKRPSLG